MSAFMVSKEHIDQLVHAGLTGLHGCRPIDADADADTIGRMLWLECHRSVSTRYPDEADGGLPGPCGLTEMEVRRYVYGQHYRRTTPIDPVAVLKAIDCYEYQSCEHDGWEKSDAAKFCDRLRRHVIGLLPGYDAAPWGI